MKKCTTEEVDKDVEMMKNAVEQGMLMELTKKEYLNLPEIKLDEKVTKDGPYRIKEMKITKNGLSFIGINFDNDFRMGPVKIIEERKEINIEDSI